MRDIVIKSLDRNENRVLHLAGENFIYVKDAPNPLIITIDNGQSLEVPEGGKIKLVNPVKEVVNVTNKGVSADFILVVGKGDYIEPQIVGEVITTPKPMTGIKTSLKTMGASVSAIVDQNAARVGLKIENLSDTESIKIGSMDVESNGWTLKPGVVMPIERASASEVYGVRSGTVDASIQIFEELDASQSITIPSNTITTESGGSLLAESGEYLTA